jgi:hypothetical protein
MNWTTCNVHFLQLMFGSCTSVSHGGIEPVGRVEWTNNPSAIGISGLRFRIERQLGRRIYRECHAVVPRVIDGLLNFDVHRPTASRLADRVARLSPIRVGSAARTGLLRISSLVFDQPRRRLEQLEMRVCRDPREYDTVDARTSRSETFMIRSSITAPQDWTTSRSSNPLNDRLA